MRSHYLIQRNDGRFHAGQWGWVKDRLSAQPYFTLERAREVAKSIKDEATVILFFENERPSTKGKTVS